MQTIINGASAGDTIQITGDYSYTSASANKQGIKITSKSNLIIQGNNHKLDGKGTSRIIWIANTSKNVKIYNLTFYNGTTATPATDTAYRGGGLHSNGTGVYVDGCRFEYCSGKRGSAISQWQGTATYTNCVIVNNTCGNDGTLAAIIFSVLDKGKFNFTNNIIVDNSGTNIITFSQGNADRFNNNVFFNNAATNYILNRLGSSSNSEYNWWGSNIPKFDKLRDDGAVSPTWVIMNFTNTTPVSISPSGGVIYLRVNLNSVFNHTSKKYQPLIGGIAPRTVYYSDNVGGTFNVTSEVFDGVSYVKYTYPAGANNITITAKVDNQILFVRIPDKIGTFTELQALIDSTPSGGTISLTKDYYYDSRYDLPLTHGMTINKPLNIIGNQQVISGIGDARIFQITGSYVNISNTTFTNGYAVSTLGGGYNGAAIYSTGSYLKVTQCTFENNTGTGTGGTVYSSGTGSTFMYNSVYRNSGKFYVSSKLIKYK